MEPQLRNTDLDYQPFGILFASRLSNEIKPFQNKKNNWKLKTIFQTVSQLFLACRPFCIDFIYFIKKKKFTETYNGMLRLLTFEHAWAKFWRLDDLQFLFDLLFAHK
jgi:hypothetical protein